MTDWQPINSAPTDGTRVLLAYRYGHERSLRIAEGWYLGGWQRHGDSHVRAVLWMPLPELPAELPSTIPASEWSKVSNVGY